MPITDWPLTERPREKLLQQGPQALSDAEILAIFIRTGIKGRTAVDLARDLLNHFGSLPALLGCEKSHFCQFAGLGATSYAQLQAALEMGRRALSAQLLQQNVLSNPQLTQQYVAARLAYYQHEVFACLFLDNRHRMLHFVELFHGTIDSSVVYPREVVKAALRCNAAAVIFAHNHPSGIAEPSAADKHITEALKQALEPLGIRVLDHIIVGHGITFSFAEQADW